MRQNEPERITEGHLFWNYFQCHISRLLRLDWALHGDFGEFSAMITFIPTKIPAFSISHKTKGKEIS